VGENTNDALHVAPGAIGVGQLYPAPPLKSKGLVPESADAVARSTPIGIAVLLVSVIVCAADVDHILVCPKFSTEVETVNPDGAINRTARFSGV
jgi:hypothetical protein